jgi:hypothetical protein
MLAKELELAAVTIGVEVIGAETSIEGDMKNI